MPDGRWLLSGGAAAGRVSASTSLALFDSQAGKAALLAARMLLPRSAHSATLLPDGTVFIHGGLDERGAVVEQDEVFDPVAGQSRLLGSTGLLARAHHNASVLSDGRVLVYGGVDKRGSPLLEAELYNPGTAQAERIDAKLGAVRLDGAAALLPSDGVLVSGGVDAAGRAIATVELFDPQRQIFMPVAPDSALQFAQLLTGSNKAPRVAASRPQADDKDVAVDATLMVRFGSRLDVATLSSATVTLIGPNGSTPIKVVPTEQGVLVFITPAQQLLPASGYTLFIKGAQDNAKRVLPLLSLGFKTQQLQAAAQGASSGTNAQGSRSDAASASTGNANASKAAATADELDEEWIPGPQHRRGEWMSHRAYLARQSLPQRDDLRRLIERVTPKTANPEAEITAQLVSKQNPRIQRTSWQTLDAQARTQAAGTYTTLTAASGVTALAGQVLRLNGKPLANVTLKIGNVSTVTDAQGEFLLSGLPAGHQVLVIDGRTASRQGATYGRYEYVYDLTAGKTNLLPFTIWMSKLDTAHAVRIDSPTQHDTVISNPRMPGLEIVLPAGTVVRDANGKIVTEVSLTPIPVDQPPYPMPYPGVPLHYTLQPGGAVIQGIDGKPRGAIVHYPNYTSFGPGAPMALFDYDAKGRGWYVYSGAKVASNGTSITSDRDFLIYQFGTTSYSSGGPTSPSPPPDCGRSPGPGDGGGGGGGWSKTSDAGGGDCGSGGDPVDLVNGRFQQTERDLFIADIIPIDLVRSYRTFSNTDGLSPLAKAFGTDTTNVYEVYLVFDSSGTQVQMVMSDGARINFDNPNGAGQQWPYDWLVYQNINGRGKYRGAILARLSDDGPNPFIVTFRDGRRWAFSPFSARLIWIEDRAGNRMTFARPNVNAYISRVTAPSGRYVDIAYNPGGLIASATDNLGRQFTYTYYAATNNLQTVTDPNGTTRQYLWDSANRLTQITNPNGNISVTNTYESITWMGGCGGTGLIPMTLNTGRVQSQTLADGSTFGYSYDSAPLADTCNGIILPPSQVTQVTDRRGTVRKVEFDADANVVKNTAALGKPEQQITSFIYGNNLPISKTDALGRLTTYEYDGNGNLNKTTRLAGTANAVSVSATYELAFNQPLTLTDENSHTTTFGYDSQGSLTSVADPLSHQTRLGYNSAGQLISVTNALNKTTTRGYSGADVTSVSDALNRQTQFLTDGAGRVITAIDPLGNRTYKGWDSLNRLTQITDARGGLIRFSYDNNGNVLTQTDVENQTTTYTYNAIGRIASMKDALLNIETRLYEPGSKLKQRTDRKGQVSGVTYDALGRVATIGFGATTSNPTAYTSTVTLTWDAGNRLTNIVDVQGGQTTTITRVYDDLNRLTREITEQGEVDYTYDNAGRRTSMTVKNGSPGALVAQPTISYTWDDANRLTLITQAAGASNNNVAQTVGFTYDDANRLTQVTYTGGQSTTYTYTDAGEVQSITYKKPDGSVIATGSYTYDGAGRRTSVSGDLATFVQASGTDVTAPTYNANNQLTKWTGAETWTYDNNGNLTYDGTNTYTWDARDQLVSINGLAGFQYDGQRRRIAKTIGSTTTGFVYDGPNFVQELSALGGSGTVNANLLTGGTDQIFMRSSGTTPSLSWFLPEANNHSVILTDSTGTTKQTYAYEPYGRTTGTGTDTNTQQYTGRENDNPGNSQGLYYYRARYYMPGCMRFISEDPIGWASGQTNNYAYVAGNPVEFTDPTGRCPWCIVGGIVGTIAGAAGAIASNPCPQDGWQMAWDIAKGAGAGLVIGAVTGYLPWFGGSLWGSIGLNAAIGGAADSAGQLITGGVSNYKPYEALTQAAIGGLAGGVATMGAGLLSLITTPTYAAAAAAWDGVGNAITLGTSIGINANLPSSVGGLQGNDLNYCPAH
jgi:RHS repeat-associated protein